MVCDIYEKNGIAQEQRLYLMSIIKQNLLNKSCKVWNWVLFIILLIGSLLLFIIFFNIEKYRQENPYKLSVRNNVVTVDFGHRITGYERMEFHVPFHLLGFSPSAIKEIRPTCKCTVSELKPDDENLLVTFKPNPSTTDVSQMIELIPIEQHLQSRFIRLKGKVIPAWFAQPNPIILLKDVCPREKRVAYTDVRINYEIPEINIKSIYLEPKAENINLKTSIKDNLFTIKVIVEGIAERTVYNGNIIVLFTDGPHKRFELPLKVQYKGMFSVTPETVTLKDEQENEYTVVEFKHFQSLSLSVKQIECPDYIIAAPKKEKNLCMIKVGLKNELFTSDHIESSKLKISFNEINQCGLLHVIVIPNKNTDSPIISKSQ